MSDPWGSSSIDQTVYTTASPIIPVPSSTMQHSDIPNDSNRIASQYILYKYLTSTSSSSTAESSSRHHSNISSNPNRISSSSAASSTLNKLSEEKKSQNSNSISVREIPSWNIYYGDQRQLDRLVEFSFPENPIRPDHGLNKCVSLCFDDVCITKLAVDAVVSSTTDNYSGQFGVARRIHEEAGKSLQEICRTLPNLRIGEVKITNGYSLAAKHVIHTNGPVGVEPGGGDYEVKLNLLKSCYEKSLNLLLLYDLRTIAFPCISTGLKGMNRESAAKISLQAVRKFLETNRSRVDRVIFCLHNAKDIVIYRRFMQIYFPVAKQE